MLLQRAGVPQFFPQVNVQLPMRSFVEEAYAFWEPPRGLSEGGDFFLWSAMLFTGAGGCGYTHSNGIIMIDIILSHNQTQWVHVHVKSKRPDNGPLGNSKWFSYSQIQNY